jgi:hypothetical protein
MFCGWRGDRRRTDGVFFRKGFLQKVLMNIKDAIQRIADTREEVYSLLCTVDAVNATERTADVTPVDGRASVYGVRLQAAIGGENGVLLLPKVGSLVVVTFMGFAEAYVALASELDQVLIFATDIQLGGDQGEKAVLGETLNSHLGELNQGLADTLMHLSTFASTQAAASAGVLAPLAAGYSALLASVTALQATVAAWEAKLQQHLSTTTTIE